MTGTSCDGADLALLRLTRNRNTWNERLVGKASRRFPRDLRFQLRAAQRGGLTIPETARLTKEYSDWLGAFCGEALRQWNQPIARTVIAAHGQTVWHEPESRVSVQLLDPAIIAFRTSCTVTSAFRQPDLARGGQGAPLVGYYHWLRSTALPNYLDALPLAIHNVGGIANLTYVSRDLRKIIAFDTGPGNALIDIAMNRLSKGRLHFDRDGKVAHRRLNEVDWDAIAKLAKHRFFRASPPKSTGRELFDENFLELVPGRGEAIVANATAFTAHTMAKAYVDFVLKPENFLNGIFVAGGGARNPTLLLLFSRELARLSGQEIPVAVLPDSFAPPQYLEPMAFARLGVEALQGRPVSLARVTGASSDSFGAGIFPGKNFQNLLQLLDMT